MKLTFLVNALAPLDENPAYLGSAFVERGWAVWCGLLHTLSVRDRRIGCVAAPMREPMPPDVPMKEPATFQLIDDSDLVWVMNRPHPGLAWDIWQILWLLQQQCEFVNRMEALAFLNNKHVVPHFSPDGHRLEQHVANDIDTLWSVYQSRPGKSWVAKPTNAAAGSDVYLLVSGDTNARPILQSMTGNTKMQWYLLSDLGIVGLQHRYAVIQEYAPETLAGEKRAVFAGGEVFTAHGRRHAPGEHRSNQVQGGEITVVELSRDEMALSTQVARALLEQGIRYGAVDIAWPYVLEFNLMCPGGLKEVIKLTGVNHAGEAVDMLLPHCRIKSRVEQ